MNIVFPSIRIDSAPRSSMNLRHNRIPILAFHHRISKPSFTARIGQWRAGPTIHSTFSVQPQRPLCLRGKGFVFAVIFSFAFHSHLATPPTYTAVPRTLGHLVHPRGQNEDAALSNPLLETRVNRDSADYKKNTRALVDLIGSIKNQEEQIREGGGAKAIESQHKKGRLTARERIAKLIDPHSTFFELSIFAAYE